jgi:hypothetical protein
VEAYTRSLCRLGNPRLATPPAESSPCSRPSSPWPALAYLETDIPGISTPYTLEVHRDHLYIFSSHEPKMAVFRLDRDATPVPRAVITSKGFPE